MPETRHDETPFYLPTVDVKPYLDDPSSEAAGKVIEEIRKACKSTGFFQMIGHGISRELQKAMFTAAAAFFALPSEEKEKLDANNKVGRRGYDLMASQSFEVDVLPDLKEGFYMGIDLPESDPKVQARRFFMGPNVWPPTSLLPREAFQDVAEAYYSAIYALALKVLEMIARSLPAGTKNAKVFDEFVANDPAAPLRFLHYPPAQSTAGKRQLGSSAHTDFGAITLLLQDENPGLEVLDQTTSTGGSAGGSGGGGGVDGRWVPVDPNPDAYVINVGDMLSKWTSGLYRSSWHRVLNKNPADRYSIVFFFDGNLDCPLAPLDGSKADELLTVEEHMVRRITESYRKK